MVESLSRSGINRKSTMLQWYWTEIPTLPFIPPLNGFLSSVIRTELSMHRTSPTGSVGDLWVLRPRTSLGVQSLHALASAESVSFRDRLGFAFATVPEDVGSGDVLGFADWAVHTTSIVTTPLTTRAMIFFPSLRRDSTR